MLFARGGGYRRVDIKIVFCTDLPRGNGCAVALGAAPRAVLPALTGKGIPLMCPGSAVGAQLDLCVAIIKVPGKPGGFGQLDDLG